MKWCARLIPFAVALLAAAASSRAESDSTSAAAAMLTGSVSVTPSSNSGASSAASPATTPGATPATEAKSKGGDKADKNAKSTKGKSKDKDKKDKGKDKSNGKDGDTKSKSDGEEEKSSKKGKKGGELVIPIEKGRQANGIELPMIDEQGRIQMRLKIDTAERINNQQLQMNRLTIETYDETGATESHMATDRAVLDLETRIVTSDTPVTVRRSDFEVTGDRMVFDTKTRSGKFLGNTRMLIYDTNTQKGETE